MLGGAILWMGGTIQWKKKTSPAPQPYGGNGLVMRYADDRES
jgi:hypothetical protein